MTIRASRDPFSSRIASLIRKAIQYSYRINSIIKFFSHLEIRKIQMMTTPIRKVFFFSVPFVTIFFVLGPFAGCSKLFNLNAPLPDLSTITPTASFIDTTAADNPEAAMADLNGNLIVAGRTFGALTGTSAGYQDAYFRKFDLSGNILKTVQFGSTSNDGIYGLATDMNENIYATGFAGGPIAGSTGYVGGEDYFVAKFDSAGNRVYLTIAGTNAQERGLAVMPDEAGEVYVFGRTGGALDGQTNHGSDDCFLAKYDASGVRQWTKLFGTPQQEFCFTASRALSGKIYLAFSTTGTYGATTNHGASDVVVVGVDANGNELWSKTIGGTGDEAAYGSTVDLQGNFYFTGPTTSSLGGNNPNPANNDLYVAKIAPSGSTEWLSQFGGTGSEEGGTVAVTLSGTVYIAGFSDGTLNGISNHGALDPLLAQFKADGTFNTLSYVGGTGNEAGRKIALRPDASHVYLTGWTDTTDGSFFGYPSRGVSAFILDYKL
jgi:hypothetical protein